MSENTTVHVCQTCGELVPLGCCTCGPRQRLQAVGSPDERSKMNENMIIYKCETCGDLIPLGHCTCGPRQRLRILGISCEWTRNPHHRRRWRWLVARARAGSHVPITLGRRQAIVAVGDYLNLLREAKDEAQRINKAKEVAVSESIEYKGHRPGRLVKKIKKGQVVRFPEAQTGDTLTGVVVAVGGITAMLELEENEYAWVPLRELSEKEE